LKTGVAIAKSSLQLLAMRTRSVEEYKHGLEVCLRDCLRLESIVQEMLALARVQQASVADVASTTQPVDLADCARDAVQKLASFAELRGVTVTLSATGSSNVQLTSEDSTHLCSNLLHNALQHSGPGSEVRIAISSDHGWLKMSIEDQGDGIPPDILPHVFEPFFRGDPSRARHSGGTGLGLSICKAICDRAGGSIGVESTVGEGTRVTVRIPAHTGPSVVLSTTETRTHSARINAAHANVERY
jgi:signal transduction histidine kinase